MSDCGNVKKVFVPTDEKKEVKEISTFDVTLTALEKIGHFLKKDDKLSTEYGLRVQVVRDGCSGNSYDIQIGSIQDAKTTGDRIFKFNKVCVIIEKLSYMFVIGSQLDYVETLLMSGFQITNPNVKKSCSCGSSFSIK
jgi:iron-sulfur cluster assembly accessory protein